MGRRLLAAKRSIFEFLAAVAVVGVRPVAGEPPQATVGTSYDALGKVTGVTNERGNTWRTAYDALGQ